MKKNIQITDHLVKNIFLNLPDTFEKNIKKSDIESVLTVKNEYYLKTNENMVNETAFMALEDYIKQELEFQNIDLSMDSIKAILNAENIYYFF